MGSEQSCGKGWGARCAAAKGTKCTCACGGRNHNKEGLAGLRSFLQTESLLKPDDNMHEYDFAGLNGFPSKCGLRIYSRDGDVMVIVFTELSYNPGTSVTNAIEILATKVYRRSFIKWPPKDFIFIEHYPADEHREKDTYDLVRMEWDGNEFKFPKWSPLSQKWRKDLGLTS